MTSLNLAFVLDPVPGLDPTHDSTVALMEAAQARGHRVWITGIDQLGVESSRAWASLAPLQLKPVERLEHGWRAEPDWYRIGDAEVQPLEQMDAVFMRKDPPVTTAYLYATYVLDHVDGDRTRVLNAPSGLRAANEKMYALQFESCIPRTIVSGSKDVIRDFVAREGRAVLKPLGGKAGEGILFLEEGDRNLNSLIELSTGQGSLPVMVQQYLPEASQGDKRIILLNGEPIGAVNRVPSGGEFRGNMAVGGRAEAATLTDRDREICEAVAPTLRRDGLWFVGLDVIGGYLTEVNVTSPTGVREIDRFDGGCLGAEVMVWLEQHPLD